jgi:hypothetical protein
MKVQMSEKPLTPKQMGEIRLNQPSMRSEEVRKQFKESGPGVPVTAQSLKRYTTGREKTTEA